MAIYLLAAHYPIACSARLSAAHAQDLLPFFASATIEALTASSADLIGGVSRTAKKRSPFGGFSGHP
jgi:hypothetical protein